MGCQKTVDAVDDCVRLVELYVVARQVDLGALAGSQGCRKGSCIFVGEDPAFLPAYDECRAAHAGEVRLAAPTNPKPARVEFVPPAFVCSLLDRMLCDRSPERFACVLGVGEEAKAFDRLVAAGVALTHSQSEAQPPSAAFRAAARRVEEDEGVHRMVRRVGEGDIRSHRVADEDRRDAMELTQDPREVFIEGSRDQFFGPFRIAVAPEVGCYHVEALSERGCDVVPPAGVCTAAVQEQ